MEITGKQTIAAPRAKVWEALNDPAVLKQCLPGCDSVERVSPEEFKVVVVAAIGPLRARFNGKLLITEANPPASCVMLFEGQGGAVGFGKGSSSVQLQEVEGGTELSYTAQAQVGGKLAQVGSRLIDSVAKKMSDDFFAAFRKQVVPEQQEAASAPKATPAAAASAAKTAASTGAAPASQPAAPQTFASPPAPAVASAAPAPVAFAPAHATASAAMPAGVGVVPAWWLGVAAVLGAAIALAGATLA